MLIISVRCLALKRECIARTKPRPRRWERKWGTGDTGPSTQPTATFSINYTVPGKPDLNDNLQTLREMHEQAIDGVLDDEDAVDSWKSTSQSLSPQGPSSLATQPHPISDIWRQPLFDMASAESLLNTFKSMVNYLPFMVFPEDCNVSHLAATNPFTLLSILTVASGSQMVQKHALYDDEFRKALGLKYVSGGEKSLELLQGVLIYCAWYPFHLRPKNGQLVQCLRMAADLVRDLDLDQDFLMMADPLDRKVTDDELDKIRAYLAYIYLVSTYIVVWRGERDLPINRPPWASTAIDILQNNAQVDSDYTLVALIRQSSLISDASKVINEEGQTMENSELILTDLRQQHHELQHSMDHLSTQSESTRMQTMFIDVFLDCGSLLVFPVAKTFLSAKRSCFPPPLSNLCSAAKKLRAFLDYVSDLEDSSLLSFTVNDWTRFIVILTLSFRLSFPISLCPDFDSTSARSEIQLDQFLSKMSHDADITTSNDLLSASRAMLGLAKTKYDRRLDLLEKSAPVTPVSRVFGCPMMDGSLRRSVEQWDHNFTNLSGWAEPKNPPLFHDVWATMTMGWGNVGDISWDAVDEGLYTS
ncbi:uncharacterized protein NECHADRAFT_81093 [Fusarium vanettenii 77-13-4]|uniref:Transcription factor domain-containing protein n=1 Tax=Fusarium vanettenii (strain ATCC MYA-4622 / CBS 123669 / FGSC 9596 / NRRL 45880 / 77-13-4) TaxID=660122 RepID=C7ZGM2_FUSV7|nr:uncharacterized protein NECHADRAFT_81093 [Fusarium vanettenii 77-13-4]EEU36939.1 hypothetical protein NECHADRAFT_81093 [Fusarium vanettenii 77-13-4]